MKEEKKVVLSLGSNIGNRSKYIEDAIQAIRKVFSTELKKSRLYETAPWGFKTDVPFLNCCISFYTSCSPKKILEATQTIEKNLGRVKKSKKINYQSRVIDIDILYVGSLIIKEEGLTVPHPLLYDRNFVLAPLSELLPALIDPVKNCSISQLFRDCNDENKVILYKD